MRSTKFRITSTYNRLTISRKELVCCTNENMKGIFVPARATSRSPTAKSATKFQGCACISSVRDDERSPTSQTHISGIPLIHFAEGLLGLWNASITFLEIGQRKLMVLCSQAPINYKNVHAYMSLNGASCSLAPSTGELVHLGRTGISCVFIPALTISQSHHDSSHIKYQIPS